MTALLYAHHSIAGWLLHLIVASTVWHLVNRLVYAHPIPALFVGGAGLLAIVVLRWQRRAVS